MIESADSFVTRMLERLSNVSGVAAIVLGGSRARGTAAENSDYDIGLYFRADMPLDTIGLLDAARDLVDDPASAAVTPIGEWGPNIVGGGWLQIAGRKVDLLYRDIDAVASVIADCRAGRVSMAYQPGHPHGFCSAIWMGEIAVCQPLHDPTGILTSLKAATTPYPEKLREALLAKFLWEVSFSIGNAKTALSRAEQTYIAGCAYRALSCIGQVLFALNRRYLINEKAALPEAASFPVTIANLNVRVHDVWMATGKSEFAEAIAELQSLGDDLQALADSSR